MSKKSTIEVQGAAITILKQGNDDFICLTDIARFKDSERTDYIIQNWLRNRNTSPPSIVHCLPATNKPRRTSSRRSGR